MSAGVPAPGADDLARSVSRVRFGALGVVATSALLLLARGGAPPQRVPAALDSGITTGVVLLALGTIVLRQVAGRRSAAPQTRLRAIVAAYACAAAIAVAGLAVGLATGNQQRGLAFALAGAIFVLGGPRMAAAPEPRLRR